MKKDIGRLDPTIKPAVDIFDIFDIELIFVTQFLHCHPFFAIILKVTAYYCVYIGHRADHISKRYSAYFMQQIFL